MTTPIPTLAPEETLTTDGRTVPQRRSLEYRIKHWVNSKMLRIAGQNVRAYSILVHVGRKSGREYRMPVTAYPLGDGYVMAMLNNGQNCDWCQNVMVTGTCKLITKGETFALGRPQIIDQVKAINAFPVLWRWLIRARSLNEFLWVHRLASPPA